MFPYFKNEQEGNIYFIHLQLPAARRHPMASGTGQPLEQTTPSRTPPVEWPDPCTAGWGMLGHFWSTWYSWKEAEQQPRILLPGYWSRTGLARGGTGMERERGVNNCRYEFSFLQNYHKNSSCHLLDQKRHFNSYIIVIPRFVRLYVDPPASPLTPVSS